MDDELDPTASDFYEHVQAGVNERLQQGEDIKTIVEEFNAMMFKMSMENGIDGWPVLVLDEENGTLSLDVEGWSGKQ